VTGGTGGFRARLLAACAIAVMLSGAACAPAVRPLDCGIDTDCGANAFCAAGQCVPGLRTCPALEPKLSSIDKGLFRVSCGTSGAKAINCHSRDGAASSSGLDLSTDSYTNLVGRPAVTTFLPTTAGALNLILVTPGDGSPEKSFLVRKLQLATAGDATFGAGMPADAPGSICADTIAVVRQWIEQGAQRN
jgi:hypothetical protein